MHNLPRIVECYFFLLLNCLHIVVVVATCGNAEAMSHCSCCDCQEKTRNLKLFGSKTVNLLFDINVGVFTG